MNLVGARVVRVACLHQVEVRSLQVLVLQQLVVGVAVRIATVLLYRIKKHLISVFFGAHRLTRHRLASRIQNHFLNRRLG